MAKADVFIQAGHKGRTSGATGAVNSRVGLSELHDLGTITERATEVLREHGISVIHEDASLEGTYEVKLAVFCHFDGSTNPLEKRASVGYDDPSDAPAAQAWKEFYAHHLWTHGFHPDNFTSGLRGYYGFKHTKTTDAEFVIEFGTITNDEVAKWIKPRLRFLGEFLAWWISIRLGGVVVPKPVWVYNLPSPPVSTERLEARLNELEELMIRRLEVVEASLAHLENFDEKVFSFIDEIRGVPF